MSRDKKKPPSGSPQEIVRALIKAGKVKKKCCRSKSRCKKCPIRALKKARKAAASTAASTAGGVGAGL